jgi:hypothetical protein
MEGIPGKFIFGNFNGIFFACEQVGREKTHDKLVRFITEIDVIVISETLIESIDHVSHANEYGKQVVAHTRYEILLKGNEQQYNNEDQKNDGYDKITQVFPNNGFFYIDDHCNLMMGWNVVCKQPIPEQVKPKIRYNCQNTKKAMGETG